MKTVELIPAGFTGENAQKNIERANKAVAAVDSANADYANKMEEILSEVGPVEFRSFLRRNMGKDDANNFLTELEEINKRRSAAREEMLRAVAGAPPVA